MKDLFNKVIKVSLASILLLTYAIVPVMAAEKNEGKNNDKKEEITFDQKIGMNGFIDDPIDVLTAGGVVREYHNYGWSQGDTPEMNFKNGTWWDFDSYYKKLYEAGITILPCIQQGSTTLLKNDNRENKPVNDGDDTKDPASYKIHANYMFNYAARYGSNKVDSSKLSVVKTEEKKSGLGYIKYFENWNEPDKTWLGEKAHFSPEEFAAMCSADYDGHNGRLGNTYGIKQADPNAKLVYGGLAGGTAGVEYLNGMKKWSEENRTDKSLPFDVINFHMYLGQKCPEQSNFVEDATKIINWRDANAKDKEVWITEFGWDTNTKSEMAAPSEDTQRDWIVREYLLADRIGIDRATVYCSRDVADSTDTTKYSTSGLTTKKGEQEKKSSWYGVNTLKNTLKGFKLAEVVKEEKDVYIYKYHNDETNKDCYVFWSPTQDGSKIDNYTFEIGNYEKIQVTQMLKGSDTGIKFDVTLAEGTIGLNISETPFFITVDEKDKKEEKKEDKDKEEEEKRKEEERKRQEEEERKQAEEQRKQEEEAKKKEEEEKKQQEEQRKQEEEERKQAEEQKRQEEESKKKEEETKKKLEEEKRQKQEQEQKNNNNSNTNNNSNVQNEPISRYADNRAPMPIPQTGDINVKVIVLAVITIITTYIVVLTIKISKTK